MPRHKDFEIWYDAKTERYRFAVEYWGSYGAKTLKDIHERRNRVRSQVTKRLKEIEKQNQEYYAKLAAKEERLKQELKKAKERHKQEYVVKYKDLTNAERINLLKMIWAGADELEIKRLFPVNSSTIAAIRTKAKREKNVCEPIQKNETIPRTGGCRIVMPAYTTDIIGDKHI